MMNGTRLTPWILVVALAAACQEEPVPEPIRPIRSMVVIDEAGFSDRWWPGRAQAAQELQLSFESAGKIIEFNAKEGDRVKAGTVLARIDPRDVQNRLARARAERERTRALLDRVRAAGRSVAEQDLTDAQARYDQAVAQVEIQQKALEDTQIVAPFDGTVAKTYFDNFQNVRRKEAVIRYLDVSHLEMVIQIPEDVITMLEHVDAVKLRFDAFADVELPGEIVEVSNEASRTTRTYPVTLAFEASERAPIQPGMAGEASGRLDLPGGPGSGGIEIPVTALFADEASASQESFVWVVDEGSSTVSRRAVQNRGYTERGVLVDGLQAGERIATAGTHTLREGQQVRIQ